MLRQVLIFVIAVGVGALVTLAVRSAWHRPYDVVIPELPASALPQSVPAAPEKKTTVDVHADHATKPLVKPVNTLCSLCGMDVDPEIPSAVFNGQAIGFACLKCPPKFAQNPAQFGPYYLRNEKVPKELLP
jgi:hypothetical protein